MKIKGYLILVNHVKMTTQSEPGINRAHLLAMDSSHIFINLTVTGSFGQRGQLFTDRKTPSDG